MPASTGMFGAQARNVNPARWARLSSARMRPLLTLSARWVVSSCALVFSVALFGGLVRLMPWLFSRDVPVGVAVPFAELLVARGTEIAALVGVPMGIGIAAALFVERGEARALESLGAHPLRVTAGLLPLGLAVLVTAAVLARSTELETPRRFATMLVGSGRRACFDTASASSAAKVSASTPPSPAWNSRRILMLRAYLHAVLTVDAIGSWQARFCVRRCVVRVPWPEHTG